MKRIILSILYICLCFSLFSQRITVEFIPGIATYTMQGLKNINKEALEFIPFNAKITNNFPAFYFYKLALIKNIDSVFSFGLAGIFCSTGSRINVADFSGEYRLDQIVSMVGPGITLRIKNHFGKLSLEEFNNLYFSFSSLKIKEYLRINDLVTGSTNNYIAKTVQAEFGINLTYPLGKFALGISGGYSFDFKSYFVFKDYTDAKLSRTGWNGFRIGLFSAYKLE